MKKTTRDCCCEREREREIVDIYRDVTRNLRAIQAKIRQMTTRAMRIPRNLPVRSKSQSLSSALLINEQEKDSAPVPERGMSKTSSICSPVAAIHSPDWIDAASQLKSSPTNSLIAINQA